jgi:hypothetical protein
MTQTHDDASREGTTIKSVVVAGTDTVGQGFCFKITPTTKLSTTYKPHMCLDHRGAGSKGFWVDATNM